MGSSLRRALWFGILIGLVSGAVFGAITAQNNTHVSDGVTVESPNGLEVKIWGETNITAENIFQGTGEREVVINSSDGNITLASDNSAHAEVHPGVNMTGTWTNITGISAGSNWVEIRPESKHRVDVRGDTDQLSIHDNIAVDDGQKDLWVEGVNGGFASVRLYNFPANTNIIARGGGGTVLDKSMSDSTGQATFDIPLSSHTIFFETVDNTSPSLSEASPTGQTTSKPNEVSVTVKDGNFDQGDEVNVKIWHDGTKIKDTNITSNTSVSATLGSLTLGTHKWNVTATDYYGSQATANYSYETPSTLFIRNETNADQLVKNANVTLTFYTNDIVEQRTSSDGSINLTGLPAGAPVIVSAKAPGFFERNLRLDSLYEQQSIYLLNKTIDNTQVRFTLNDPTGRFSTESTLIIQRPINQSGTLRYRTVNSDQYGVEGVTAELEKGIRYQILIENTENTVQRVGPYRADVNETVTVQPGTPSIDLGSFEQGWAYNAKLENRTLTVAYSDPEQETDSITVYIYEKGNKSNQLRPNSTFTTLGNFTAKYTLTENESKKTWVVIYDVSRDGEEYILRQEVSNNPDLVPDLSREWRLIGGVGALLIFGGAFSILNAATGAIMISIVGGVLWFGGWLTGATTGIAIVIYMFIAVLYNIYKSA